MTNLGSDIHEIDLVFCPAYAPILGSFGLIASIGLTCAGSAYGTAKAGMGIISSAIMRPESMMRNCIPAIMAGLLAMFGVLISYFQLSAMKDQKYSLYTGALHMAAGFSMGFSGLSAGIAIGIVGDAGVRGTCQQPRIFVGMVLILIFAEVLGLYGLFMGINMIQAAAQHTHCTLKSS